MNNIPFILLAIFYFSIASKLNYWITISRLGFYSQCPKFFLEKEGIYHYTTWFLFLGTFISIFPSSLPIRAGIPIILGLWLFSSIIGRSNAFKKYREIVTQLMESTDDLEKRKGYEKELLKSDTELLNQYT